MTLVETLEHVERCVGAISAPLYEGVSMGYTEAVGRLGSMARIEQYPSLVPMTARAAMRNHWLDQGLGPGWTVEGRPALSVQTILVNRDEGIELRLLKERRRNYPGGVPVAGRNPRRRRGWTNGQIGLELEDLPTTPQIQNLLLLWDHITKGGEPAITVRVVRPLSPGRWGEAVPIDINFEIDPTGAMFDTLSFRGDPQHQTFFPNIAREDNDEAASGN